MVRVPGSVSVAKVLETLLNQSKGKVTEAREDDNLTVYDNMIKPCEHGDESVVQNGREAGAR
jgi:CTP synthase (UTP-ammonia lyase)